METQVIKITKIKGSDRQEIEDLLAVEAQYQVEINGKHGFSFTCTPQHLKEMTVGALYSRGYIEKGRQIREIKVRERLICVKLEEASEKTCDEEMGINHKKAKPELDSEEMFHTVKLLFENPDTLFNRTGCAHSCSLMKNHEILCTFEDIGRHNALDKVIGYALLKEIPMEECVIFTSGRVPFDYMTKIIRAGFRVAVSRAAVTVEAVQLAKEKGVTLYGFVRGNKANLYTS